MKLRQTFTEHGMPSDIAAGPRDWPSYADWFAAGQAWNQEHGLKPYEWRRLLDEDVAFWSSSLGSAMARSLEAQGLPLARNK